MANESAGLRSSTPSPPHLVHLSPRAQFSKDFIVCPTLPPNSVVAKNLSSCVRNGGIVLCQVNNGSIVLLSSQLVLKSAIVAGFARDIIVYM